MSTRANTLAGCIASLAVLLSAAPTAGGQPRRMPRADTITVTAGSGVVDFSKHAPGKTRAVQTRLSNGQSTPVPEMIWTFAFTDTGGHALLHIRSSVTNGPRGTTPPDDIILDRRTLSLFAAHREGAAGMELTVTGTRVQGDFRTPDGASIPVDVTLASAPFVSGLQDLLVESLPCTPGIVYRIPLWRPGQTATETRLYQVVRREDIDVLGHAYPQACVFEERNADDGTLRGTLWTVEGAPHLVRWSVSLPDGGTLRLDQEAITSP